MYFDLWTLLVEQLIGGFWLTVLVIMVLIFLIMGVLGKMSKFTVIYFEMLFFMTMTVGYGYKWLTTICAFAIIVWVFFEYRWATSG